jgi:hypothetical protein
MNWTAMTSFLERQRRIDSSEPAAYQQHRGRGIDLVERIV